MHKFFILILSYLPLRVSSTIMIIFRRTIVLVQYLVSSPTDYERTLVACVLNSHPKRISIPDVVLMQLSSWKWAQQCSKHVEESNKCIKIKNLCIKLVKKGHHYTRMHGQQNVNILKLFHKTLISLMLWQSYIQMNEDIPPANDAPLSAASKT